MNGAVGVVQTIAAINGEATALVQFNADTLCTPRGAGDGKGASHTTAVPPPFAVERQVWLSLYEAARLSIIHRTAIVLRSV